MKSTVLSVLALCLLAMSSAAPVSAFEEPPAAQEKTLKLAFKLIGEGQFQQAKVEIERAAAMGGPCGECLLGLAHIHASEKKWEQAIEAARQAIPLLKSPGVLARAYNQLGIANVMLGTPESLAQAEDALRRAVEAGGAWGEVARYNLAELLFRRQSWAEAAGMARAYLEKAGPDGTALKEAHVLLCRARTHLPDEPTAAGSGGVPELKRVGGEVRRPELLVQAKKPVYTPEARRALTKGKVIVEAIIDEDGCVRKARELQGLPNGLTESAIEAVQSWVFLPATFEGRPVKVYYVLTVNFQVQPDLLQMRH